MTLKNKASVGIYCRLSDEDRNKRFKEDDSQSIQNQKSMLIDYCIEKNWDIYKIYSDDDYSGADRNRPEWRRLLKDCEDGKINIVLCKSLSRFSRELEIIESYIHGKFPCWGVRFVGVVDNADTDIEANKKQRQLNSLTNEWYLEDVSNNVRRVLHHMALKGQHTGAFAPYGYKKDPLDKHRLVIDENAAETVKMIFNMYCSGKGITLICRELNRMGIPTPSLYKRLNGEKYYSRQLSLPPQRRIWGASSVALILDNEMYIGNMVLGRHKNVSYKIHKKMPVPREEWCIAENTHEAIIDNKTWELVRQIRNSRKKGASGGEISSPLIFKLYCGECGAPMGQRSVSSHKGKYKYRFLYCPTCKNSDNCSNSTQTSLAKAERIVKDELNGILKEYYDEKMLVVENNAPDSLITQQKRLLSVSAAIDKNKRRAYELYLDRADGIITREQFAEFNKEIAKETERLEALEEEMNESLKAERERGEDEIKRQIKKYSFIEGLNTRIINEFIDKITIKRSGGETVMDIFLLI